MVENKEIMRLAKALASAGIASRRKCEDIIKSGKVFVNGERVINPATNVSESDLISVDGVEISTEEKRYYAFYKPSEVLSTMEKKDGVRTVSDFFKDEEERLFYAGRLDYASRGLMIVTNDGHFAQLASHPSRGIEKMYHVTVKGIVNSEKVLEASKGITVKGVRYEPFKFRILKKTREGAIIRMTIHEGKNREIRNIFEHLGYPVMDLERISIGPIHIDSSSMGLLSEGEYRELTEDEIKALKAVKPKAKSVKGKSDDGKPKTKRGKR